MEVHDGTWGGDLGGVGEVQEVYRVCDNVWRVLGLVWF